jgi:hypothetical protein
LRRISDRSTAQRPNVLFGNGARLRLWKWELQQLANRTGLTITISHFPRGQASGTRASIGCFRTSAATGEDSRW